MGFIFIVFLRFDKVGSFFAIKNDQQEEEISYL